MNQLEKIKKIIAGHEERIKKLEGDLGRGSKDTGKQRKPKSIMDFLMELKNDGFFTKPKLLKEIKTELSRRGHHYKTQSLTEPLQRAVRQRKLGRIGEEKKWQYVRR